METENEQALEGVEEQEENTQEEETEESEEETVTIPKAKFNSIRRKAAAYDTEKTKPKPTITNTNSDAKWRERMELKVEGFDNEAVEFIMKNGGRKALENPYVVKAVEGIKEQRIAEKATVEEGSKSTTEKRFSPQEFAKLPASEQMKVMSELL